ncbi:MAG: hypothetical protein KBT02_03235 [Treponema sp.]|nr:hypothetical protein [Candidatus Treponema caballi]
MRKFNLYFDDIKYTLNGENNVWFTNPTGLGADYSPSMVDLRNGFFKPISTDIIPQNPIVGDITFTRVTDVLPYGDAYALYRDFAMRVSQAKKIEFAYQPYGTDEFRCEVKLEYITKTEKSGNWLTCPVSFMPLTPWYKAVDVEVEFQTDEDSGGYFAELIPQGDIPAAIEIEFDGCGMPSLLSVAISGEYLGGISVVYSGRNDPGVFKYSSKYNDSYATFTPDATGEPIDMVSLEPGEKPFARLKPFTQNYILILFMNGAPVPTSNKMKLYYYYRSV